MLKQGERLVDVSLRALHEGERIEREDLPVWIIVVAKKSDAAFCVVPRGGEVSQRSRDERASDPGVSDQPVDLLTTPLDPFEAAVRFSEPLVVQVPDAHRVARKGGQRRVFGGPTMGLRRGEERVCIIRFVKALAKPCSRQTDAARDLRSHLDAFGGCDGVLKLLFRDGERAGLLEQPKQRRSGDQRPSAPRRLRVVDAALIDRLEVVPAVFEEARGSQAVQLPKTIAGGPARVPLMGGLDRAWRKLELQRFASSEVKKKARPIGARASREYQTCAEELLDLVHQIGA